MKKQVNSIGLVCPYCGTPTEDVCCGEMHHEEGFETEDGEIVLESELDDNYEVTDEML